MNAPLNGAWVCSFGANRGGGTGIIGRGGRSFMAIGWLSDEIRRMVRVG
ncbi:hypothetical protein JYQ62_27060 [Nostoc sp. UHCC 0702]|nr:hypothetical protein JYQ62_27060 [Nostoc sp. UHCC 0702]